MNKVLRLATILGLAFFSLNSVLSQTVIYMEKEGGVYSVPCKVNDVPLKFIFDTGASNVSISLAEAMFMLKNNLLSENDILGTSYSQFADGKIAENTQIVLKVVQIADIKIYNVRASIVHNLSAPLLFGQSAIEKLGKIQLEGNKLTILNAGRNEYNYADYYPTNDSRVSSSSSSLNLTNCKRRAREESYSGSDMFSLKTESTMWEYKEVGGSLIANLPSGAKVKLISRVFDWWKVESNGKVGWIVERKIDLPTCMLWLENLRSPE